jgi:hypothetical protein
MSVFEARLKIEAYLKNCINDEMKSEAVKDFRMILHDTIEQGYTWGARHAIPIDIKKYSKDDLRKILGAVVE